MNLEAAKSESHPEVSDEIAMRVKERTAELEAANEELQWFAYSLSHDLRSSLTTAGMAVDLLRRGGGAKDQMTENLLGSLADSVQKMRKMVDAALKLAGLTGGAIEQRAVDLSAIVHEIVGDLRQADPGRHVTVTVAPDIEVQGEEMLLQIVLENLLNNAWKFTSKTRDPRIEFGVARRADRTVFFVADNGAGFDMNKAGAMFSAFQRLHRASEFPGTGIGLATVKRIVDRHGGRIWAESIPGHGATFFISLPSLQLVA